MRHRFHSNLPLTSGALIELAGDELHHARVLRLREGEPVEVFDGRGMAFAGTTEGPAGIRLGDPAPSRESPLAVHLAMSVINLDKFELVLQKATELGVASITPLLTDRMEVRVERFRGKRERWQKILFEAVKQSGRAVIPALHEATAFDEAIALAGEKIVYDADELPTATLQPCNPVTLYIGPEGGFSPREVELARQKDTLFASLGLRRLRAETAAIVAVARIITA
jgi:16S rRNA (uracil1498-N3)-methyltransferase